MSKHHMSLNNFLRTKFRGMIYLISLITCLNVYGQSDISATIPVIDGANVFAQYNDDMPMVVNYFTQHSEQDIINFYQEKYGDAVNSTLKRGRLSLVYRVNQQQLTVIISTQGKIRQVDAMLR